VSGNPAPLKDGGNGCVVTYKNSSGIQSYYAYVTGKDGNLYVYYYDPHFSGNEPKWGSLRAPA
jgi:hypothetical protein